MRKYLAIISLLLFCLTSNVLAEQQIFTETRTVTSTHHLFSFTYESVAFTANHVAIFNRGSKSVWCDPNGNTAVADTADPTTHPLVFEVPAGTVWENDFGTAGVDCVASGSDTSKIMVQGTKEAQ